MIEDDDLLKKYNDIWNNVSNIIKKELACGSIYNKTFLKTKIILYGDGATDFYIREILEAGSKYIIFWSVILIDFSLKNEENYYLLSASVFRRMEIHQNKKWLNILLMT